MVDATIYLGDAVDGHGVACEEYEGMENELARALCCADTVHVQRDADGLRVECVPGVTLTPYARNITLTLAYADDAARPLAYQVERALTDMRAWLLDDLAWVKADDLLDAMKDGLAFDAWADGRDVHSDAAKRAGVEVG